VTIEGTLFGRIRDLQKTGQFGRLPDTCPSNPRFYTEAGALGKVVGMLSGGSLCVVHSCTRNTVIPAHGSAPPP
jgi:hypothetical protein